MMKRKRKMRERRVPGERKRRRKHEKSRTEKILGLPIKASWPFGEG